MRDGNFIFNFDIVTFHPTRGTPWFAFHIFCFVWLPCTNSVTPDFPIKEKKLFHQNVKSWNEQLLCSFLNIIHLRKIVKVDLKSAVFVIVC